MRNSNLGLGGEDGALALDLVNLKGFTMDNETWHATIGAGTRLGKLDEHLHGNGARAMAHGTCPGVGIGGHATIVSFLLHHHGPKPTQETGWPRTNV